MPQKAVVGGPPSAGMDGTMVQPETQNHRVHCNRFTEPAIRLTISAMTTAKHRPAASPMTIRLIGLLVHTGEPGGQGVR